MQKNNRTILFLAPYPFDQAPSQRFRFEQYVGMLEEEGFEVQFYSFLDNEGWRFLYTRGNLLRKSGAVLRGFLRRIALFFGPAFRAHFVFIHREAAPIGPPVFEFLLARVFRKPVVYDFDDAIWLPNTSHENRFAAWLKWHSKVGSICRWSYRVSAGNAYLAAFARRYATRVVINPTTVNTLRFHVPSVSAEEDHPHLTLGWTGTHSTLKYLEPLKPVWTGLLSRFGTRIRLLIIADRNPSFDWPQVDFIPWTKEREAEDLCRMDIGLMPLVNDPWAEGKCGLKALQYMALAIPAVASPVGVNTQIIRDGETGLLCDTPEQWREALARLIEDPILRQKLGKAGREHVVRFYSVDSNRSNFVSLFR